MQTKAARILKQKNGLDGADAKRVEASFADKMFAFERPLHSIDPLTAQPIPEKRKRGRPRKDLPGIAKIDKSTLTLAEPKRRRDKEHLRFVAGQPCLVCGRAPCDAHHLRFAQPRALGLKASDEFTVPLCRTHHRENHRMGNESDWWSQVGLEPLEHATALWKQTRRFSAPESS